MNRILQVNIENIGGVFTLIHGLSKKMQDEYQFDYYTMGNFEHNEVYNEIINSGSCIYESQLRFNKIIGHLFLPIFFYNFLMKHNYNIIHIHSDTAWKLLCYAIPAKLSKRCKIIVHSHSSYVNGNFKGLKILFHNIAKLFLPLFADELCSCSEKATEWMYPQSQAPRVKMIYNGVDIEKFKFDDAKRDHIRNMYKIGSSDIVIGHIGSFTYAKNPEYVIEVFKKVYANNKKSYLLLVGKGPYIDVIHKNYGEEEFYKNIIFYGQTQDVSYPFNAMDIFLLPSRCEGLPMVAVEAQTNGLLTLLSNQITQEVGYSNNCVFLPISENDIEKWCSKINAYKFDSNTRRQGWIATQNAHFSINNTKEQMMDLYRSLEGNFKNEN